MKYSFRRWDELKGQEAYNFLTVDMVHVEQLHNLKGSPKTYSFSIRPAFSADGFLLPLFIRNCLRVGDSYLPSSWRRRTALKGYGQ